MAEYQLTKDDIADLRKLLSLFREVVLKRYAETGEIVASLPGRLELLEIAVRESSEDEANAIKQLRQQVKRLEELWLLRETGREDSPEAEKHRGDIRNEHSVEHLQEMYTVVVRNLQRVRLKEAKTGGSASLELLNQIDELETAKTEIEEQLAVLRKQRKR